MEDDLTNDCGRDLRRLLTCREVSEQYGININTLYALIHQGRIPFFRNGRLVRFRHTDLEEWIGRGTNVPANGRKKGANG